MPETTNDNDTQTLFGHPTGLYTLFFAEMWERFSYYGMRALLVFYMIKGFLGYNDNEAYAVYGAYTALVYATPYLGGMLADRLLGARRAVVLGGLLMAAGHLLMGVENRTAFFAALALLILGNGFFKPNISTIVGSLYPAGSPRRDGGFTIFYMGINLGAAMSPVLCGYIGETYGWHYGFGLATAGMLVGVAVFVAPVKLTQLLILGGALGTSIAMPFMQDTWLQLGVRILLSVCLTVAGVVAFVALGRGGLPAEAGQPADPSKLTKKIGGVLRADWAVYLGVLVSIPIISLIVQRNEIAGWALNVLGAVAACFLIYQIVRSENKVESDRQKVIFVLLFFTLVFWAFFEQAGSSVNNFTDRNVDRVFEERTIAASEVGQTIELELSQEQLGRTNTNPDMAAKMTAAITAAETKKGKDAAEIQKLLDAVKAQGTLTMTGFQAMRDAKTDTVQWTVSEADVGMGVNGAEIPASEFQGVNPIYILLFGLAFSALWVFLGTRGMEPSTPVKFAFGILQLGLGFGAFWYGAQQADSRGMVGITWLLIGYLLQTTGELCLSPVGLSMVTKMSPPRLVSTWMGAWFLATAFSNYLAGVIAQFTGVSHGGDGGQVVPAPTETVAVYGDVFGKIAIAAIVCALICFALAPFLKKWMHPEVQEN